jgi:altronate dehydratase small subunit
MRDISPRARGESVAGPKGSQPWVLKIHEKDNVGTAVVEIPAGHKVRVVFDDRFDSWITAQDPIPMAHKVALRDIATGTEVLKYGECIGQATTDIAAGCHVHVHNITSRRGRKSVDG